MPIGVMKLNPEAGPNLYEVLALWLPCLSGTFNVALEAQTSFAYPSTCFNSLLPEKSQTKHALVVL